MAKLVTQKESFANHAKLYEQAQGIDAINQNQADPYVAMKSFSAAMENLTGTLTAAPVSQFTEALNVATGAVSGWAKSLSQWAQDHPTEAKIAGGAALGGGLAVGGTLTYQLIQGLTGGSAALKVSATALDGSAAALTRAAAALAGGAVAGGAGSAAAGAAGGAAAAAKKGGFLSRVAKIGKVAAGASMLGAVAEAAPEFYDHVKDENNPGAGESRRARGATVRNAYRSQFAQDRERLGIDTGGFAPPAWTVNAAKPAVPAAPGAAPADQSAFEGGGGGAVPYVQQTQEALQQLSSTVPGAGAEAGQGFQQALTGALRATLEEVQSLADQIRNALTFSASPSITPSGGAAPSAAGGEKHSSMPAYDHRYASHGDGATHWSA